MKLNQFVIIKYDIFWFPLSSFIEKCSELQDLRSIKNKTSPIPPEIKETIIYIKASINKSINPSQPKTLKKCENYGLQIILNSAIQS